MNLRKFYLVMTMVVSVFLFGTGTVLLYFMSNINVLEAVSPGSSKSSTGSIFRSLAIGNDPFNVLFLVDDKASSNTDTIMLANYNPATNKVSIMSIPRDTKVYKSSTKSVKINSLYAGKNGIQNLTVALDDLMGVKVNYYCHFDIKTIKQIINELGGVDYYVPADMYYFDPTQDLKIDLKKGRQRMDGDKAEQLLRFRKPAPGHNNKELKEYYDGSDLNRVKTQQNFLKELFKQKMTLMYVPKISNIVQVVYNNLETNMPQTEIFKLLKNISSFSMENVSTCTLPGTPEEGGSWYYVCDRDIASQIVQESFQTTLPQMDTGDIESHNTAYDSNNQTEKPAPKKSTTVKSFTKGNPSNADSGIKGTTKADP